MAHGNLRWRCDSFCGGSLAVDAVWGVRLEQTGNWWAFSPGWARDFLMPWRCTAQAFPHSQKICWIFRASRKFEKPTAHPGAWRGSRILHGRATSEQSRGVLRINFDVHRFIWSLSHKCDSVKKCIHEIQNLVLLRGVNYAWCILKCSFKQLTPMNERLNEPRQIQNLRKQWIPSLCLLSEQEAIYTWLKFYEDIATNCYTCPTLRLRCVADR